MAPEGEEGEAKGLLRPRFWVGWGMWGAGGSAGKESVCNAGDLGLIPGLGRSTEEEKGYRFQNSGLKNSVDYMTHTTEQLSLGGHGSGVYMCLPLPSS